ncbi:Hydantoin utilization protein C [Lacunisphaera limnophila]|uniref:Hydantoin utilization protein C n=1 Tax=Lacunisphaera limnophila TaxID=1838286 RepID=A0A1D8ATS3_9BACT|nr:allantoate amidohydrolase [Lacunisphaera limnophila]AOS44293.1 Hydantoin utilization protein C [Lacunisphaera limnophila]
MPHAAQQLARRLDELGRVTDEPGRLTRTFLSPAMERANALVGKWMQEAGLTVREDDTGNLIGRLPAGPALVAGATRTRKPKTLLLGSHLDTVRNAGRFDGALGVVLPIVALAELKRRGVTLPFAVEVLGFSEEEAVRFTGAYLGSKAYTGRLRAADLLLTDSRANTLREVIEAHAGHHYTPPKAAHRRGDLLGYVEVHIEQGPVLEDRKLAVGVVSAIASQTRGRLTFRGRAGHAGTTPMNLRRDALAGAAEFILFAEKYAGGRPPLVATVGTLAVPSGAANVIPGETVLSLDVRHPDDTACRRAVDHLIAEAQDIARRRGLTLAWQQTMKHRATPCSPELTAALDRSVRAVQGKSLALVSGAGHDGVIMADLTPIAMLFVRCRDGLSHHPDEYAAPADLAVALQVMVDFLERLAADFAKERG